MSAIVSGRVHDGNTSLSGATVSLKNTKTDDTQTTTTDSSGNFTYDGVSTGTYSLTVSPSGYASKSCTVSVAANTDGVDEDFDYSVTTSSKDVVSATDDAG